MSKRKASGSWMNVVLDRNTYPGFWTQRLCSIFEEMRRLPSSPRIHGTNHPYSFREYWFDM